MYQMPIDVERKLLPCLESNVTQNLPVDVDCVIANQMRCIDLVVKS